MNGDRYEAQCAAIESHLQLLASVEPPERSISAFLLERGRFFNPSPRPGRMRRGTVKQCYANSQRAALRSARRSGAPLVYVEGYACSGGLSVNLPLLHGWLADTEGDVIDLTWDYPEASAYFGVAFSTDYVAARAAEGPIDSLLDSRRDDWRLLRDPELADAVILDAAGQSPMTGGTSFRPA